MFRVVALLSLTLASIGRSGGRLRHQRRPPTPPRDPEITISLEELRKLSAAGDVTIVDVRDSKTFAAGHIPGAISIPLGTVGRSAERLRRLGKPVVTYCS